MADISKITLPNGETYNIDAITVEGHTVKSDVPAGAVFTIDSTLSNSSTNPVQNRVITNALNGKANASDIPSISGLQTQTITDAGGYFSTDTVEAALQQLGASVDGVETLLAAI